MKLISLGLLAVAMITGQERAHAAPAYDRYFNRAGAFYRINADLLRAIARVESGGNSAAVNRDTHGSEDVRLMQINSRWLPRLAAYGIRREHLFDPCVSISVGARILRHEINHHGPTWNGVGRYNAKSLSKVAASVKKVFQIWRRTQAERSSQPNRSKQGVAP